MISFEGETILQVTKSSFVLEQMLSCQGAGRVIIDPNSLLEFSAAFGTANAIVEISEAATIKFPHFHHFLIESEASITVTAPDIVSYPSPSGKSSLSPPSSPLEGFNQRSNNKNKALMYPLIHFAIKSAVVFSYMWGTHCFI